MKDDNPYFVRDARELRGGKDIAFDVAKFPDGRFPGLLLRHKATGVVYSTQRYGGYDIRKRNKAERAAWCRLTGMTNAALAEEAKRYAAEAKSRQHAERIEELADEARSLGYALVEMQPAESGAFPSENKP